MERAPAATGRDAQSAPERAPAGTPGEPAAVVGGPLGPAAVLALQRAAGNAAVTALPAREPVTAPPKTPLERLREVLANKDEDAAIAQMATLSKDDAAIALGSKDLRDLAVKAFNDDEMARALTGMKGGTLLQKVNWLAAEGSSWKLVRRLITAPGVPPEQKTELYSHGWARSFFTDICDDDEMEEAVRLLGGTVEQKLNWMLTEGTNAKAVFRLATSTTDADMPTALPADLHEAMKDQLSAKDYEHAREMLTGGLLNWDEVEYRKGEKHYELKDKNDPSKGYELVEFDVHGKYEIAFTRTQLKIKVRIKFTGETPDHRHLKIWGDGITAKWNGKFHLENGRRLAIVFEPIFNSAKPHHKIKLHKPPIVREDAANWYCGPAANPGVDTTDANTAAHEFGHLFGMADEYNLRAADYTRLTGQAVPAGPAPASGYTSTTVMGAVAGPAVAKHYERFVTWLNQKYPTLAKPFVLKPGP
jgi:hypothetical protein